MTTVGETTPARWGRPDGDLEPSTLGAALQERLRAAVGAESSALWVRTVDGDLDLVAAHGPRAIPSEGAVRRCLALGRPSWLDGTLALPLRVASETFGAVALSAPRVLQPFRVAELQETADEFAGWLDTALLVDGARTSATAEERRRVAREIHDGVAQRIVGLGYLADDLAVLAEGGAREAVESLRDEITRIAGDLRLSLLDLRGDHDLEDGIPGALSAFLAEIGSRTDLRIHLHLDERGGRPPRTVEREVLAIAQEAIGNVRQHARATNLWVTLTLEGHQVRLAVEDDGFGAATPRPGHYGLQGMRERAKRIDAGLEIVGRPGGGTVVTLLTRATTERTNEGEGHDHQRLARR